MNPTVAIFCSIFPVISSLASTKDTGVCLLDLVVANQWKLDQPYDEVGDYAVFEARMKKLRYDRTNEMMPIHFGNGNLYVIFRGRILVDKTLIIEKILDIPSHAIIITGPKRFCKSVNSNMLQMFFGIEMDANGDPVPHDNTTSYKMFHDALVFEKYNVTKEINPPFLISKNQEIMEKYQGKYPVLRLELLVDPLPEFKNFIITMKYEFSALFEAHKYMVKILEKRLQQNPADSDAELKLNRFKLYLDPKSLNIRELELTEGINFLCKVLKDHFNKAPIVLIDDIRLASSHVLFEKNVKYRKKVLDFYHKFFYDTLRAKDLHTKVIITGVMKMTNFSRLNDYTDINLLRPNTLTPFFGFKRKEVEEMFEAMNLTIELRTQALQYFKGLQIGQYQMYNPHSIIEFAIAKKISMYWGTFTSISIDLTDKFSAFKDVRNSLHNLAYGHSTEVMLHNMNIVDDDEKPITVDRALRFFVAYGYFTLIPVSETVDKITCVNEEMRSLLKLDLISYIKVTMCLEPDEKIPEVLGQQLLLFFNDKNTTSKNLREEFKKYLSSLDLSSEFTKNWDKSEKDLLAQITLEDYVHDMMLYLLSLVEETYYSLPKNTDKFNINISKVEISEKDKLISRTYTAVNYGNVGVILEAKFNHSEPLYIAFDQIQDYSSYFHPNGYPVEVVKHIVVNIFENKTADILARCFNISRPVSSTTTNAFICAECSSTVLSL